MDNFEQTIFLDDDKEDEKDDKEAHGLVNKLLKSRTILACKGVDDKLMTSVVAQLFVLEQDDPNGLITVIVNSPGGSADSGFAMYDALRFCKCPIRTVVMGMCASAGVNIFLGGDEDKRFCTPSARFLLHQPSMRTSGQASDLEIASREIDRMKESYNQMVSDATGRSLKDIENDVNRDFWLSAEAAVEYGLVTKIINHRGELD